MKQKTMKSIVSMVLAAVMCLSLLPMSAFAADSDFVIEDGVVIEYTGNGGAVVIPDGVTSIGYAFIGIVSLTSVTIPNSVTTIGHSAFRDCKNLTSVTMPNSITSIEEMAFQFCEKLKSITIPSSVTSIGESAFSYCKSLTSVTIPDGVTSIGQSAFSECTSLTSVTIPNSVTTIKANAFASCDKLKSVVISDYVTDMGSDAFTSWRTAIHANTGSYAEKWARANDATFVSIGTASTDSKADTNTASNTFGEDVFEIKNGVLTGYYIKCSEEEYLSASKEQLSATRHVTIPDNVTIIGENAITSAGVYVDNVWTPTEFPVSVTIPNSVTTIDDSAFKGFKKLTSVTIPNSVTTIGESAFEGCIGLTSITIPNSVTSIGARAFYECDYITSVTIPSSVTDFGDRAFLGCGNLTEVTIQDGVKIIGSNAFAYCRNLTSVTIPNSVTTIGEYAFSACTNLKSITIPESVTSIGTAIVESATIIKGKPGSAAEAFVKAAQGYYTFEAIDGTTPPPATDKPSAWAEANVNTAITANIVPQALQTKYTQATTRAEFAALAVALYEKVKGAEITERTTFNDTTDINVQKAAAIGVVSGVGNNNFAPNDKLTREQAATMLSRLATAIGKPLTEQAATFADNGKVSTWAAAAVGQVQATGIMGGVGNNTFAPKEDYTREQSIVTALRLYDIVK